MCTILFNFYFYFHFNLFILLFLFFYFFIFIYLFLFKALVHRAQAMAKEAKIIFEIVTQRILTEFSFFEEQKIIDLRDVLLNFVKKQVSISIIKNIRNSIFDCHFSILIFPSKFYFWYLISDCILIFVV